MASNQGWGQPPATRAGRVLNWPCRINANALTTPRKRATLRIMMQKLLKRSLNMRALSLSLALNGVIKRDMTASAATGSMQEIIMNATRLFMLNPATASGERRRPKLLARLEAWPVLQMRMFMRRMSQYAKQKGESCDLWCSTREMSHAIYDV